MNGLRYGVAGGLGLGWLALFVFFFYLAGWNTASDEVWFPFQPALGSQEAFFDPKLDAPAGNHGFVQAGEDGNFYFESGDQVRFWGVALGSQLSIPPKEISERLAAELSALGFNLVRISYLDQMIFEDGARDTRHFDVEKLDRFDYLVSQLKAQGIYIDLVLTGFRRFRSEDGVMDWDEPAFQKTYEGQRLLRSMAFVDPRLNQLQREYSRQLLTHRNPYTGNLYTDEPAIAMLELINETSLTYGWIRGFLKADNSSSIKITPYYSKLLDVLWNVWLLPKYGSREKLSQAWAPTQAGQKGLLDHEDPSTRSVERVVYQGRGNYSQGRVEDQLRFYIELERNYYDQLYRFLKSDLKVKIPISGTHTYHGMANQLAQAEMDFMGGHAQWQHPIIPRGQPWSQLPIRFLNTPMVKGQAAQIPYKADWVETRNTLFRLAFGMSQLGKPFVVSEYNHSFPNEYQAEFPFIMGAYLSLQDWDGFIIHHYAHTVKDLEQTKIHDIFMIHNNPVILAQMPLASKIFREALVRVAQQQTPVDYSFEQILQATDRCGMDIYCLYEYKKIAPESALIQRVGNVFEKGKAEDGLQGKVKEGSYASQTGELTWDLRQGIVKINSPYVQGVIGFVGGKTIYLKNLIVQAQTDFAVIALVALDGEQIAQSQKLGLVAVSRVKNEGLKIDRDVVGFRVLNDWGHAPILVQDIRGRLQLISNRADQLKVFSLNRKGQPGSLLGITINNKKITFQIGGQKTLWYGLCASCELPPAPAPTE